MHTNDNQTEKTQNDFPFYDALDLIDSILGNQPSQELVISKVTGKPYCKRIRQHRRKNATELALLRMQRQNKSKKSHSCY